MLKKMANMNGRNGAPIFGGGVPGGLSPLSETLWRDKANTDNLGDTSARLTWVDLWVTVHGRGPKQAILQGLTGTCLEIAGCCSCEHCFWVLQQ